MTYEDREKASDVAPVAAAGWRYYDIVAGMFVGVYIISQVASVKLVAFGDFQFPGAIIIFPIAYIFGDILTEVYGYARARRVIWTGFASAFLLAIVLLIVQYMPAPANWTLQKEYDAILGFVPRIVLGSLVAYCAGEFVNSYVLAKLKVRTSGRHLWFRTIGSTLVGQAIDSIVFALVAFGGVLPIGLVMKIGGSIYVAKVLYEIAATPLTYLIVNFLKRVEGVDVYDRSTKFSPFRLDV